jgi:hypothetical protein
MASPEEIRAAYAENEAAMKRTVPLLGEDDYRLCVEMAAEQTGASYEEARGVMLDEWAMVGSG